MSEQQTKFPCNRAGRAKKRAAEGLIESPEALKEAATEVGEADEARTVPARFDTVLSSFFMHLTGGVEPRPAEGYAFMRDTAQQIRNHTLRGDTIPTEYKELAEESKLLQKRIAEVDRRILFYRRAFKKESWRKLVQKFNQAETNDAKTDCMRNLLVLWLQRRDFACRFVPQPVDSLENLRDGGALWQLETTRYGGERVYINVTGYGSVFHRGDNNPPFKILHTEPDSWPAPPGPDYI